jgi:hypothetical protein
MDDHDPQLAGSTLSWLLHFTGRQLFSYRVTVVGKRDKRISDKSVIHALRSPPQGRRFRFPYRGFFQGASPLYVNTRHRPRFSHTPLSCIKGHGRQEARLIANGSRGFAPTWSCLSASFRQEPHDWRVSHALLESSNPGFCVRCTSKAGNGRGIAFGVWSPRL